MNRFGDPNVDDSPTPMAQGVISLVMGLIGGGVAYAFYKHKHNGWAAFFALGAVGGCIRGVYAIASAPSTAATSTAATAAPIYLDDQPSGFIGPMPGQTYTPSTSIPQADLPPVYMPPPNPTGLHPTILNRVTSIPLPANPHVDGWWNR